MLLKASKLLAITALFSCAAFADKGHHHHHDKLVNVSNAEQAPKIKIIAHKDASAGWNLELVTQNFQFAPRQVNASHQEGNGHAHLYVDGKKVARLYGNWYHLGDLSKGMHSLKVTLNSNDHGTYAVNNQEISAEIKIEQ